MWYNGELPQFPSNGYGQANPDMSNFEGWGHFSQVVWAGSTKVGCKTQFCPAGTVYSTMDAWFTVCNYYPAGKYCHLEQALKPLLTVSSSSGNVGGAYGKNVFPPTGAGTVTA
jgi:hypothetical protein